jgi:hypothetical protein
MKWYSVVDEFTRVSGRLFSDSLRQPFALQDSQI